jgi:hypothetical protein
VWDANDSDLNVLTGKNDSGKTTLLKLLWYCLSGNVNRLVEEMTFERIIMETSSFRLEVALQSTSEDSKEAVYRLDVSGETHVFQKQNSLGLIGLSATGLYHTPEPDHAAQLKAEISELTDSSVYFPTFRRIEGGYGAGVRQRQLNRGLRADALQEALSSFSERLATGNHQFVASISTHDIAALLTSKYAEVSRHINRQQKELAEFITKLTYGYGAEERKTPPDQKRETPEQLLTTIRAKIDEIEKRRIEIFKPFEVLSRLVEKILEHRGIKVTDAITFGKTAESITSDKLSAGEKQMILSFKFSSEEVTTRELKLHSLPIATCGSSPRFQRNSLTWCGRRATA